MAARQSSADRRCPVLRLPRLLLKPVTPAQQVRAVAASYALVLRGAWPATGKPAKGLTVAKVR